jgi:hypothetical protein
MSHFLGIGRERVFSPGRAGDDSAILEMAAAALRQRGHVVQVCGADETRWPSPQRNTLVFTMAQGSAALARLSRWEADGVRIVNRPQAILNCQRHRTLPALAAAGVPFPESILVDTAAGSVLPAWLADGAWVKRGDVHATDGDDVVRADGPAAVRRAMQRFRGRGIETALVQRHVAGEVIKFYAVHDRFFYCVPPPGGVVVPPETASAIDALGARAARALGVEIYGGDCVYGPEGLLKLIDLNDWPSYAACRAEAARSIAAYLLAQEVLE